MPTFTLISKTVLTSTASTVTFSSIPATYTDLCVRFGARSNSASFFDGRAQINSVASGYAAQELRQAGTTSPTAALNSGEAYMYLDSALQYDGASANSWGSSEMYLPDYTTNKTKIALCFSGVEENTTDAAGNMFSVQAHNTNSTEVISSITFSLTAGSFVSGSSFFLYGIKNS